MYTKRTPIDDRFWSKVLISDNCWLWSGYLRKDGYAGICECGKNGRKILVHRYSYEFFYGKIPEKLLVCHKCDVRNCVRPSHLFLGTNKDNSDDKISKGRNSSAFGELSGTAKLKSVDVPEIRRRFYDKKESRAKIAKDFNVSSSAIESLILGKTWKHVK